MKILGMILCKTDRYSETLAFFAIAENWAELPIVIIVYSVQSI